MKRLRSRAALYWLVLLAVPVAVGCGGSDACESKCTIQRRSGGDVVYKDVSLERCQELMNQTQGATGAKYEECVI